MGNIKSNSKITAADISALKTKIQAIYANRSFLSSAGLKTLDGGSPGFGNTSIAAGNYINNNFYYALNALLQLQDITGVIKNGQYNIIFQNGVSSDLLTTINDWETTEPKTTTQPISCRGGCVGFCYNACSGTCTYNCYGSSDASKKKVPSALSSGVASAPGCRFCDGKCLFDCTASCYYGCTECCGHTCENGCDQNCQGGCNTTCTGGCGSDCTGGCLSGCTGGCKTSCGDSCMLNCSRGAGVNVS